MYWPIIGLGTRTWSVAMRCRDPAGQSEFFVRVLRLKTLNLMYCYRELIVGIVVSAIAVFKLVDNIVSNSLHCKTDCSLTYLQTWFMGKLKPWHWERMNICNVWNIIVSEPPANLIAYQIINLRPSATRNEWRNSRSSCILFNTDSSMLEWSKFQGLASQLYCLEYCTVEWVPNVQEHIRTLQIKVVIIE